MIRARWTEVGWRAFDAGVWTCGWLEKTRRHRRHALSGVVRATSENRVITHRHLGARLWGTNRLYRYRLKVVRTRLTQGQRAVLGRVELVDVWTGWMHSSLPWS